MSEYWRYRNSTSSSTLYYTIAYYTHVMAGVAIAPQWRNDFQREEIEHIQHALHTYSRFVPCSPVVVSKHFRTRLYGECLKNEVLTEVELKMIFLWIEYYILKKMLEYTHEIIQINVALINTDNAIAMTRARGV